MIEKRGKSLVFYENLPFIIENTNDLISIVEPDYDFKIEFVNQAYIYILGYSNEDVIGKSFLDYIYPADVKKVIKFLKKGTEFKTNLPEIRIKRKDEKYIWFEFKVKKFKDPDNQNKLLLISRDISKIKNLETKIEENERRFKEMSDSMPEIRFWKLLAPKKTEEIVRISNEMLQNVIENIPEYIFWKDTNLVYLGCNKNYAKLIGADQQENVIGKIDEHLILDKEKVNQLREHEINILKTKKPEYHIVQPWIRKNGEQIWLDTNRIPLHDSKGKIAGILTTYDDITELRITEQKLKESEDEFKLIFENANDMISILNSEMKYEYINEKAFLKIIGRSKKDLIGKRPIKWIHPDDLERAIKIFKEGFEAGEGTVELRFKNKNGDYLWFEIRGKTFFDLNGEKKALLVSRDVTERKKMEEKIKEHAKEMEFLSQIIIAGNKSKNLTLLFEKILSSTLELMNFEMGGIYLIDKTNRIAELVYYKGLSSNFIENAKQRKIDEMPFSNIFIVGKPIFTDDYSKIEPELSEKFEILSLASIPLFSKNKIIGALNIASKTSHSFSNIEKDTLQSLGREIGSIITRMEVEEKLRESEEKYRHLFQNSPYAIILMTSDGNVIDCNSKLEHLFGYKKSELIGKRLINFPGFLPEDLSLLRKKHKILLQERMLKPFDIKTYKKDGTSVWTNIQSSLIELGKKSFVLAIIQDISEKKMYERLIYELNINFLNFTTDIQKNIEMLLNTCCNLLDAPIVLYVHRSLQDGRVKYQILSSDRVSKVYDSEEFEKNFYLSELFKENNDYIHTKKNINESKYFKTDPYIIEYKAKGCFGKLIKSQEELNSALCVFFPENPLESNQTNLVLFLISDAIEIEQRRWQVQQHLEEQNKLKQELFTRTSHELKTPLISIKGFTDLLLTIHNDKLDTGLISIIEEIKEGSSRLEKTINSLLIGSMLDQDQLKLNMGREDLSFLIKFCINELHGLKELRNQTINLDIPETLEIYFDKERIYDVIANLLVNALKYTPPNGEITIGSEFKENSIIISIKDNGIGLTEPEKSQLFKPFGKIERYGKGWDVDIEGSGLGLYISKKIVEMHGGRIWAESDGKNKGSTFFFSLPIILK